jgi:hypothetical protein
MMIEYSHKEKKMNSLDKILKSMRKGEYCDVIDPKGGIYIGIINGIMREDGSGKNWIVTVTNSTSKQVFIHAT